MRPLCKRQIQKPPELCIYLCPEISSALDKIPIKDWPSHVDDPNHRYYGHPLFLMGENAEIGVASKQNTDWVKSHKLMIAWELAVPANYGESNE